MIVETWPAPVSVVAKVLRDGVTVVHRWQCGRCGMVGVWLADQVLAARNGDQHHDWCTTARSPEAA